MSTRAGLLALQVKYKKSHSPGIETSNHDNTNMAREKQKANVGVRLDKPRFRITMYASFVYFLSLSVLLTTSTPFYFTLACMSASFKVSCQPMGG